MCPVKRPETHPKPAVYAEKLIHRNVVRLDPADPAEHAERHKQESGQEEECKRSSRCHNVVLIARKPARLRIILRVKRVKQRARNQILRPDHARGPDEEPTTYASESKARQLRREYRNKVEPKPKLNFVINLRDNNRVERVRVPHGDIRHDVDQRVFLDIPRSGVERERAVNAPPPTSTKPLRTGNGEPYMERPDGKAERGELAHWVRDQDEYEWDNLGRGLAEVEEHIHGGPNHAEQETDDPHAERKSGHFGIVDVRHRGANLREGGVLFVDIENGGPVAEWLSNTADDTS